MDRRIRGAWRTEHAAIRWRHRGELAPSPHRIWGWDFLESNLRKTVTWGNAGVIPAVVSEVAVRVIRTDEERMIAKTVCRVLGL